jgi:hypothetical protein
MNYKKTLCKKRKCKNVLNVILLIVVHLNVVAPWGLYYETFYGSNCSRVVIS